MRKAGRELQISLGGPQYVRMDNVHDGAAFSESVFPDEIPRRTLFAMDFPPIAERSNFV